MNNKDKQISEYIQKHFNDINRSLEIINDDYRQFENDNILQKAISFDLLQIGELFNSLSNDACSQLNKKRCSRYHRC